MQHLIQIKAVFVWLQGLDDATRRIIVLDAGVLLIFEFVACVLRENPLRQFVRELTLVGIQHRPQLHRVYPLLPQHVEHVQILIHFIRTASTEPSESQVLFVSTKRTFYECKDTGSLDWQPTLEIELQIMPQRLPSVLLECAARLLVVMVHLTSLDDAPDRLEDISRLRVQFRHQESICVKSIEPADKKHSEYQSELKDAADLSKQLQ